MMTAVVIIGELSPSLPQFSHPREYEIHTAVSIVIRNQEYFCLAGCAPVINFSHSTFLKTCQLCGAPPMVCCHSLTFSSSTGGLNSENRAPLMGQKIPKLRCFYELAWFAFQLKPKNFTVRFILDTRNITNATMFIKPRFL